jgi:hypothetical protein
MEVQRAFGSVVGSLKSALESHVKVDITVTPQGWCVHIFTPPEAAPQFKKHMLHLAKDRLLRAASNSKSVYVMGYDKNPFTDKTWSFDCVLGLMLNKDGACWDLFAKGYCHRQGSCRWDHAALQSHMSVMIQE